MSSEQYLSKVDNLPIRPSGPWIKDKYYYLSRYSTIFTKAMRRKWNLTFVDLFAGPGRCLIEATGKEVDGSALQSLQYDFHKYIFVEQHPSCLAALKERSNKSPKAQNINFFEGDCNALAGDIAQSMSSQDLHLIFADPTKINIHFKTIEQLTCNKKADLLLNIQFGMDIKRNFARYKKEGDSSPMGLFLGGGVDWGAINESLDVIKFYKKKIKDLGFSTVEYKDMEVRNTKNASMYFLFFASRNSKGIEFWKKITSKHSSGQLEFL